ncbi:metallophosphoesterase [Candidatus Korarchaeum cryptofilum]|uniref:Predicted phosphoesterase n=1 Tax=Korarchaeum cryptofilum (strain OPF8) TaxID=374847 RepID=B1L4K1_KORCO|nr:metallophosphoesterase [Candidatus Korarchaeum cryptofilum]ACB07380.1 Predicted phosphoesterase [Candidatus Korarchaeum cryptofilum OPF8]
MIVVISDTHGEVENIRSILNKLRESNPDLVVHLGDDYDDASFLLAGVIGTLSHVLLDSPLYGDIRPFYPIEENPLYNPSLPIHEFCVLTLPIGALMYLIILMRASIHRASNSRDA